MPAHAEVRRSRAAAVGLVLLLAAPGALASRSAQAFREALAAYASFDHERAARIFEESARDGHVPSQRMIAFMYSNGQGVERNERIAAEWYCRSVERGLWGPGSCPWFVYLTREQPGFILRGIETPDSENLQRHLLEAERGDVSAQVAVGLLYASGVGTPRDLVEAYRWLARAAEQRHPTAGQLLEALEREMTREQILEGRRRAGGDTAPEVEAP